MTLESIVIKVVCSDGISEVMIIIFVKKQKLVFCIGTTLYEFFHISKVVKNHQIKILEFKDVRVCADNDFRSVSDLFQSLKNLLLFLNFIALIEKLATIKRLKFVVR